jgi:eukaryotic-like serine/threonine-protein kinase
MLTGEPPHYANTSQAIIARLLTEQPRSVRLSRPSVPEHVELALMQALAKLPADRWSTAGEFADALQGRGVPLTHAALPPRSRRRHGRAGCLRQRASDPVTITLALVALLGIGAAVRERMRPSVEPPVVRFPLTLPADVRVGSSTVGSPLAISPDGQVIVFTATGADGTDQLWRRALDDEVAHPMPGTRNAQAPFFSPDGQWVAFWSAGKLQKIASAGTSTPLTLAETPIIFGGAWSKSGVIVIAAGPLFTVSATGGELRRLTPTSNTRVAVFPYALDDGEHAIYAERGNGGLETARLTIVDLRSGETRALGLAGTHPLGVIDGFLVYGSAANGVLAAPFDVRSLRETGGATTPLASDVVVGANGGTKAALSPTGTLVYQSGTREAEIVAVDTQGKTRPLLSTKAAFGYPRLSPDGKTLAVTEANGSRLDIWTFDLASGTPSRLTSDGGINERPEWTPDGKHVLFRSDRGTHPAIWSQPADRSEPAKPLLVSARESYFEAVMTPDSRGLVYQMDTLNEDIFYRALSGDTTPRPIAASGFNEDRPRVSPDGKWVAFVTEESGNPEVVVQPLPGPGARVQVSAGGGVEPVWSRDGKRIFYRAGARMMAATVATAATSPAFTVTSRTPLFEGNYLMAWSPHANYDVTPDGRELIMVRSVGGEQVIVVHNWRQELKKRMGR